MQFRLHTPPNNPPISILSIYCIDTTKRPLLKHMLMQEQSDEDPDDENESEEDSAPKTGKKRSSVSGNKKCANKKQRTSTVYSP
jgi:hypothetical protein